MWIWTTCNYKRKVQAAAVHKAQLTDRGTAVFEFESCGFESRISQRVSSGYDNQGPRVYDCYSVVDTSTLVDTAFCQMQTNLEISYIIIML